MESLNNFYQSVLTYRERQENSEVREKIRKTLGFGSTIPIVCFGEQPHMLGGVPKSIAKSLCGAYLKLRDKDIRVIHYIAASNLCRAEREIYMAKFPDSTGSRKGIGIPRRKIPTNTAVRKVTVFDIDIANITAKMEKLVGFYQPELFHSRLYSEIYTMVKTSAGLTLSDFNIGIGRKIRSYLGLAESTVVEDDILETQLFLSDIGKSLFLQWPEMLNLINKYSEGTVKPLDRRTAPIWIFSESRETLCPLMIDNKIHIGNQSYDYDGLCSTVYEKGWHISFRAIPRIFALSAVFDGLITGGGSHYMDVVSRIAAAGRLDVFPFIPSGGLLRNYITGYNFYRPVPESIITVCRKNEFCILDMLFSTAADVLRDEIERFLNLDDVCPGRDDFLLGAA